MHKKRVVRAARLLGNGRASRHGEAIAWPGYEIIEDIIRREDHIIVGITESRQPTAGVFSGDEADGYKLARDCLGALVENIAALPGEILLLNGGGGANRQNAAREF